MPKADIALMAYMRNPKMNNRRWGIIVFSGTGNLVNYQHAAVYGPNVGYIKSAKPSHPGSKQFLMKLAWALIELKQKEGYVMMGQDAQMADAMQAIVGAATPKGINLPLVDVEDNDEDTFFEEGCPFCATMHINLDFNCYVCGKQDGAHTASHPHSCEAVSCICFTATNAQWESVGWHFETKKLTPKPKQVESPLTVPGCPACAMRDDPAFSHGTLRCTVCNLGVSAHLYEHPHRPQPNMVNIGGCVQLSLPPVVWKALGWDFINGKMSTKPSYIDIAPDCEFCKSAYSADREIRDLFYKNALCACGKQAGLHVSPHPHYDPKSTCSGFKRPLAVVADEEPKLLLADLPCDCGPRHYLSVHGRDDTRCLVVTCHCEYYKRTCQECHELTRTVWRHKETCLTGLHEKLTSEPIEPQPEQDIFTRKGRAGFL